MVNCIISLKTIKCINFVLYENSLISVYGHFVPTVPKGDPHVKLLTGVIVGNYEKNPYKAPKSHVVGVAHIRYRFFLKSCTFLSGYSSCLLP